MKPIRKEDFHARKDWNDLKMKSMRRFILIVFTMLLLGGCASSEQSLKETKSTQQTVASPTVTKSNTLSEKIENLKNKNWGATTPEIIYASEQSVYIRTDEGIIIYSLSEQKIKNIINLNPNEIMGEVFIQGSQAYHIYADKTGAEIVFCSIRNEDAFYIYTVEKGTLEKVKSTSIDEFTKQKKIPSQYRFNENEWIHCADMGVQISEDSFVYLVLEKKKKGKLKGLSIIMNDNENQKVIRIFDSF